MRSPRRNALLAAGLAALVLAAPAAAEPAPQWSGLDARSYAGPIPPEGGLITTVPLDPALSVTGAAKAFRILYATQDQHDRPAVSTAAVFVPHGAPPAGGWPVIAWAHGTVGLGDDCTPSARPRSARDNEYLSHWLDQGYVVVGTDYAGLGTPGLMSYLNSVAEAHAVIDSVRAVHQMDLPLSPKWAIVGQSQGGGAAINSAWWATRLSAGTGLDYRGVVATGTPANTERVVLEAGPDLPPRPVPPAAISYTAYIVAALREGLPAIPFDRVLTPRGRELADQAETVCKPELDRQVAGTRLDELFSAPVASLEGIGPALDGFMGTPTDGYDRPIFLGHGLLDTDVPPQSTQTLYQQLVDHHQDVELHIYRDQDHSGTVLASMPDSTRFLHRIMTDDGS
ncbi:alpha/beta hydrolase family protein [Mycolicibacter arupensis]|uniref:alpha/beta hydrolase family protein n=1 Tax=Mycolicibacter arupensis TaxID=342002 RepID=UPI00122CA462|nr:lipase family protein [Mycolicibacter arupensis]KAA1430338.1 prolyl oligopeptidase family serine peptidase [Mycolicibacter arupensis]